MPSFLAAVVAGLALLIWSADIFIEGAAALANLFGVSVMIIGITIVGFGTSAPEIVVSAIAVLNHTPDIAVGNALGSNIANIGLILGVIAMLMPVPVASRLLKTEYPLLILATAVMTLSLYDLRLGVFEGLMLLGLLMLSLYRLIRVQRGNPSTHAVEEQKSEERVYEMKLPVAIGWVLLGLVVLVGSSKLLVWGASGIALELGVSELIIGLTVVALGTSLPEFAASIASLKKGKPGLAIGNVIGSNLFNSLAVIGLPALLTSFSISPSALTRDVPVVIALTLALVLMSRFPGAEPRYLTRSKGIFLFAVFVIYQLYLYHDAAVT